MGTVVNGTPMSVEGLPVEGLPVEGSVVTGETILETGPEVQTSPSDSTVTSDVVQPPVSAESSDVAPEDN